ncbi:MAG: MBL fold metallo-hydrolase [Nanoarchaeota archaeon]
MSFVTFTALGGCQEVGKNAFLFESDKGKYLMDYGLQVQDSLIPMKPPDGLDGVFLSHSHLDHCGAIPVLYKQGYKGKVYLTAPTLSLTEMLLKDSIKVQERRGQIPHFLMPDAKRFMKNHYRANYKQSIKLNGARAEFHDAGHIPGSSLTLLETGGKRILYTGDIKFEDTVLMSGADTKIKNVDVLVSETTYCYKNHPKRSELAEELKEKIQEILYNNSIAVLPSFAVGRTQELLLLVYKLGFPVYMDGMGIEATQRILLHPRSIKNPQELRKAFSRAHKIKHSRQRQSAIKNPSIVITTAGMLQGGPVNYYIENLYKRPGCSLILTGYQVEGTVGRTLMDTGRYINEGIDEKLKMKLEFMDFSGHAGKNELIKFYEKINPKKIILVHGEHSDEFVNQVKGKGFDVIAPKNGQKIKL